MPQLSWPTASVLVAIILVSGGLSAEHVISPEWIERSLSGVLGIVVGTAFGLRMNRGATPGSQR